MRSAMSETAIHGYTYGNVKDSPVTSTDLAELKASVLFGPEDEAALREAGQILGDRVEDILDVWYGFVGSNPHLVAHFTGPDGQPNAEYLAKVRGRFGQWILDTCNRAYDEDWLAYQQEIGLRHTSAGKNTTDQVESTPYVPLRHLIALIYPITATIRPFLEADGQSAERVDLMHDAWRKSVILQIALWSRAYLEDSW
jgi:Protoglobin